MKNKTNPNYKKALPVKINRPIAGVELYFCPYCLTGHMLDKGQQDCDICKTKIIWPKGY